MVFLETERFRLSRLAADIRYPTSTLPRDLPPGINAFVVPRAVNTHALVFPLRHTAPRTEVSFLTDIFHTTLSSKKWKMKKLIMKNVLLIFHYSLFISSQEQSGMEQRPVRLSTTALWRSPQGTGILTCYPSVTPFGLALGPTNPTPITVAWETLGIRRADFSSA